MTSFALIQSIVFVLLAVSIHLGAMHLTHILLPYWTMMGMRLRHWKMTKKSQLPFSVLLFNGGIIWRIY